MAARSVKNLNRELDCPVCMDTLKNPKLLSCFHAFCEECLKQCDKTSEVSSGKLKCPKCRKVTTLSGAGVAGLKSNPLICKLLEVLEAKKNSSQIMCDACGDSDSPLTTYCRDCLHFICDSCASYHGKMKRLMKDHRTVPLDKIVNGTVKIRWMEEGLWRKAYECEEHSGELRRFYCRTCKRRICRDCIVLDHTKPDHDCTTVQKMFQEIQEKVKDLLKSCNEKEENVCTMIHDVKIKEKEANLKFQEMKTSIRDLKATAVASLNNAEKELLQKVDMFEDKLKQKMKAFRDSIETTKDNLIKVQSRAKDVVSAKEVADITRASFFPEDVLRELQDLIASKVIMTISMDFMALKGTVVQGPKLSEQMAPFAKLTSPHVWRETRMPPNPDKDIVTIFCDGTSVYVACKKGFYKTRLSSSVNPSDWVKLRHDNPDIEQVVDMAISMKDKTLSFIAKTKAACTQLYRFGLDDFLTSQQFAKASSPLPRTSPCPLDSSARITIDSQSRIVVANNKPNLPNISQAPARPVESVRKSTQKPTEASAACSNAPSLFGQVGSAKRAGAAFGGGFTFGQVQPQQQPGFTGTTYTHNSKTAYTFSFKPSANKTESVPSPPPSKGEEVKTDIPVFGSSTFTMHTTIYRANPDKISTPSGGFSFGPSSSSDNFKVPFERARSLSAAKSGQLVFLRWDKKAVIITDGDGRVQHEIKEPGRMYLSISCTESDALYLLSAFWGSHTVTLTKHSLADGSLLEYIIDELDLSEKFQSDEWPVIGNHGNDLVMINTGKEIRVYSAEDWDILDDHQSDDIKDEDKHEVGMDVSEGNE